MVKAVYPEYFDPVTLGHLDIIQRAARVSDQLVVGITAGPSKASLFSLEERIRLLKEVTEEYPNVTVQIYEGLISEFAKKNDAHFIIKSLRAVTDFDAEMQAAHTNRRINPELDTMFFTTSFQYAFLSSALVKEIASHGGDIKKFVPQAVIKAMAIKTEQKRS